jgi:outer membrane protein OmpA-like peptidoglycan-associated protein
MTSSSASTPSAAPTVVHAEQVAASTLVVVSSGNSSGLAHLVAETARPEETLVVLAAGSPPRVVVSSISPRPVAVAVPPRPVLGSTSTAFQADLARGALEKWREAVRQARTQEREQTKAATTSWVRRLGVPATFGDPASLGAEIAMATTAIGALTSAGGAGGHRVLVVETSNLAAPGLAASELAGDTVVVIDPIVAGGGVIATAEGQLDGAGAARAVVVTPESAVALGGLVARGLADSVTTTSFAANVLFGNDSATLTHRADVALSGLLPILLRPGATAVVDGYASTTGPTVPTHTLAAARAAGVVGFLVALGAPAARLWASGHGATDLVAPGPSAANRRVVVVVSWT